MAKKEAVDYNFGRSDINCSNASAYMLLYVRESDAPDLLAPLGGIDTVVNYKTLKCNNIELGIDGAFDLQVPSRAATTTTTIPTTTTSVSTDAVNATNANTANTVNSEENEIIIVDLVNEVDMPLSSTADPGDNPVHPVHLVHPVHEVDEVDEVDEGYGIPDDLLRHLQEQKAIRESEEEVRRTSCGNIYILF